MTRRSRGPAGEAAGSSPPSTDFLIADPQLSVHLNVTDWLRIGGGAGYRFVGRAGSDRERLRGFTASIGLQLGPPWSSRSGSGISPASGWSIGT